MEAQNGAESGSGLKWKVISVINVKSWTHFRIRKMMQKSTTLAARNTNLFALRAGLLTNSYATLQQLDIFVARQILFSHAISIYLASGSILSQGMDRRTG
jgi:hypothetical protein